MLYIIIWARCWNFEFVWKQCNDCSYTWYTLLSIVTESEIHRLIDELYESDDDDDNSQEAHCFNKPKPMSVPWVIYWFYQRYWMFLCNQGFYINRIPNSLALFWTRVFSRSVHFGQTTLNSDVIMLYNIYQVLELKSPKRQLQLKVLHQNIMQQS